MLDAASDDVTLGDRDDVSDAVSSVDHRSRERALLHLLDVATKNNKNDDKLLPVRTFRPGTLLQCLQFFCSRATVRTSTAPSTDKNDLTCTCFTGK